MSLLLAVIRSYSGMYVYLFFWSSPFFKLYNNLVASQALFAHQKQWAMRVFF